MGDDGKMWISFCNFYQDTLDLPGVETLWDSSYQGRKVSEFLSLCPRSESMVAFEVLSIK